MFKIDEKTMKNFSNLSKQIILPENFLNNFITEGESKDFYLGFASALSLSMNIFAQFDKSIPQKDKEEFIAIITSSIAKTYDFYKK